MRARTVRVHALAVLGGVLLLGAAEAGTFRFEDQTGTVYYTNAPSDPRYRFFRADPEAPPRPRQVGPTRALAAFTEAIRAAAQRYSVDQRLVEAVIVVESGGNAGAVSRKGAQGLMQLMPQRSAELGVRNPFDARQNLDGGVRHLRDLLQRFDGNVTLALAAYNAGEAAVRSYQGIPPFAETQDYVRKVRALYDGASTLGVTPLGMAPQQVYQLIAEDGTITFTNLPPNPNREVQRRF